MTNHHLNRLSPCLKIGVALYLVILLLVTAGAADAQRPNRKRIEYRERISGSAAPSAFDVNGDGSPAHSVTFAGWSTLGLVNGGFLVEYDFGSLAPDAACPGTTLKVPILASASNRALTVRALGLPAGQVFLRDDHANALFCLNPATGSFTMSVEGQFAGGIGILEGATGEYSYEGSGQVLLQDVAGLPFGGFTIETIGTIILP